MNTGKANNDQEGGRRTRKAPAQAKGLSLLGADEISQPTALPKIEIDLPYLESLWRRQKGSCALTAAPLELTGAFGCSAQTRSTAYVAACP